MGSLFSKFNGRPKYEDDIEFKLHRHITDIDHSLEALNTELAPLDSSTIRTELKIHANHWSTFKRKFYSYEGNAFVHKKY